MATVAVTNYPTRGQVQVKWTALANGQSGDSASIGRWRDRTIQAMGVFGVGGTVTVEGSQDGSTWGAVTDHNAVAITLTDGKPRVIAEGPLYIRPRISAGDGTTAINVILTGGIGVV